MVVWYKDGQFTNTDPLPRALTTYPLVGPRGLALVSVYKEGKTQPGWGLSRTPDAPGWAENYAAGRFLPRPKMGAYSAAQVPFAIVMRSAALVCLDIDEHDGGASGFDGVQALGPLPPTLAETSRSGAGRHLFYRVPDTWDDEVGYGSYDDVIGLAPGVDLRATGCVYHYSTQRWNDLTITDLPETILLKLRERRTQKTNRALNLAALVEGTLDSTEALIMQDTILSELDKPIPAGQRNNTLFAIGTKLKMAQIPGWEERLAARAEEVGLDADEIVKLVNNINRYA